jgi:hypothetical protein
MCVSCVALALSAEVGSEFGTGRLASAMPHTPGRGQTAVMAMTNDKYLPESKA